MTLPNPPGDIDVAPGQTIGSTWGNAVWDQSTRRFASAASRDAALPAPHEGALVWLDDPGQLQLRRAGAWVPVPAGGGYMVHGFRTGNILPGTGSQFGLQMGGWAAPPTVIATLAAQFNWGLRLSSVAATTVYFFATDNSAGNTLPDGTAINMHLLVIGAPLPGQVPYAVGSETLSAEAYAALGDGAPALVS